MAEIKQFIRNHARRQPKTQRGRDTKEGILAVARRLVSERWVYDIPFVSLATEAGVARASLFHAFPRWSHILERLLTEELDILDHSFAAASALKRAKPSERVYAMLVPLLDRAEQTGWLYSNLRSEVFAWQGESKEEDFGFGNELTPADLRVFALISLADHYASVEELLGGAAADLVSSSRGVEHPIGECLVNLALDLAAGSPSHARAFDERRQTLRFNIDLIAAGLQKSKTKRDSK